MKYFLMLLVLIAGFYHESVAQSTNSPSFERITGAPLIVEVDLAAGGRIVSLKYDQFEFLTSRETEPQYFGATFWLSPQSEWWRTNDMLDTLRYHVIKKDKTMLHIESAPNSTGLQITKTVRIEVRDSTVRIQYQIRNLSPEEVKLSPWELIRTSGGETFFPGETPTQELTSNLQHVNQERGIVWFKFNKNSIREAEKLFMNATEGWLSHRNGNALFVKAYQNLESKQLPPGQSEVEIYVNEKATYAELETHGKYATLSPGESLTYNTIWHLRPLDDVHKNAAHDALVSRARMIRKRLK